MSRNRTTQIQALSLSASDAAQQRLFRRVSWLVGLTLLAGGLMISSHAFASTTTTAKAASAPASTASSAQVVCANNCGVVTAVKATEVKGKGSGLGLIGGAVIGGLVGNQVGKGTGNTIATVGGAVAGGYAGNEVEKHVKKSTVYKTTVKLDNGTTKELTVSEKFEVGTKVIVEGKTLKAR